MLSIRNLCSIFFCILLITTCKKKEAASLPEKEEVVEDVQVISNPDVFAVRNPDRFPLFQVESRKTNSELITPGVVAPDISRTVPVLSLSGGRVLEVYSRLGDEVKKGQLLISIHSPDLAMAFADYKKFEADNVLAKKFLERAKILYEKGAIAGKELQVAEDTAIKAQVDLDAAKEKIIILGGDPEKPSPVINITSPIGGTIIEQNITKGAGVKSIENSQNLFVVADLSRVWVLCDLYENNLPEVKTGDRAIVTLSSYPDHPLKGVVGNIARVLNPETRSAKVRIELRNDKELLRPGMFASVKFISQIEKERIVIPASSVLRMHDRDWVFLSMGGNLFKKIEVLTGPALKGNLIQVYDGLELGQFVVSEALSFSRTVEENE